MLNESLSWNIRDGVGYLMLNQPPANPMTLGFFLELDGLTKMIKKTQGLKGIIISGQGRHFSSGADLKELTGSINDQLKINGNGAIHPYPEFMHRNLESLKFFNDLKIPVIAAIKGVCIGSAFELSLFCHFRFCTSNVVLGLPESTYGLMPGLGGIQQLFGGVDKARVMEIVIKGETFNENEAMKIGIIDRIIPKDRLTDSAVKLVEIASLNYRRYNKKEYLQRFDKEFIN
jgi:enoyl-CoA hydratase/carnithine racemase